MSPHGPGYDWTDHLSLPGVRCLTPGASTIIAGVKVPGGVHEGWKCVGEHRALTINIPDQPYRYDAPDEHRVDPHQNDIPYCWDRRGA
jgi:hypothetical protein